MAYRNYCTSNGFIVAKDGNGDFSTISSAMTAATSGQTIFVRPGQYNETVNMKAGVNIAAFTCDGQTPNVTLNGKLNASYSGTASVSGIRLQTNSDFCVAVTGSNATVLNLSECFFNLTNNTGISYTNSNSSSGIYIKWCAGETSTTGIAYFSASGAGELKILCCSFENHGLSTTAATMSAGTLFIDSSRFVQAVTTSSTGVIQVNNSYLINSSGTNQTIVTHGGSATNCFINNSYISSGTSSAVSISSTLSMNNCVISSSNTNAITGAGTLNYSGLTFQSTSSKINTTTQTGGIIQGGLTQAPSAGFIGEQIRSFIASGSAVSISLPNTPQNITSISLTAGVWDVSCVGVLTLNGATVTNTILSISTTSATNGTEGDNYVYMFIGSAGLSDGCGSIPAYRLTLTATTTVYMVMQVAFTVANPKGFGRLSATRVG